MHVVVFGQNADEHTVNHWVVDDAVGFFTEVLKPHHDLYEFLDIETIFMAYREVQRIVHILDNFEHLPCIFFPSLIPFPEHKVVLICDEVSLMVASPPENILRLAFGERDRRYVLFVVIFLVLHGPPIRTTFPSKNLTHMMYPSLRLVF